MLSSSDDENESELTEAELASMDKETRKKYTRRKAVCDQITKVMDVKNTQEGEIATQESRS